MRLNYWDLMALGVEDVPTFTEEERARITRVHNELQEKYDPVAAYCRKTGTFPFVHPKHYTDYNEKLRYAERAAGYTRKK